MTVTESHLRAEAVDLTRHIAEAIYNADHAGLSHRDAPTFLFSSRDTIERYTRMAVAARAVSERDVERRLDRALDGEGEIRSALENLREQVAALFAMATSQVTADGDDVVLPMRVLMRDLADLIDFDHAGWFDS